MCNIRWALPVCLLAAALPLSAQTIHNDDSCDIGVAPAATLLLPYFEVDLLANAAVADSTIVTVTNVSRLPQIAHYTIWTDWGYPLLAFNVLLTPYDVQTVNLYDVIVRGAVPAGEPALHPPLNNPNHDPLAVCVNLPKSLPKATLDAMQRALTIGVVPALCGNRRIGGVHTNAIGYMTIDVVNDCSLRFPDDPEYLRNELLFDNVLIGDYQQVDGDPTTGNFAGGNPLVHIRAIPEGGAAGTDPPTNLAYTFYDRYTAGLSGVARNFDRRQPLPSIFAARWIQGGIASYETNYKIWREGLTGGVQSCADMEQNAGMVVNDLIRFDERENAYGFGVPLICPCPPPMLPAASRVSTWSSFVFPPITGDATAGWMYLDLNNRGTLQYSVNNRSVAATDFAPAGSNTKVRASQNWVVQSMFAQGRYGVDFDAAYLGNGCTSAAVAPATPATLGPARNETPSGYVPH